MKQRARPITVSSDVALFQNLPNPFSAETCITFQTPRGNNWRLVIRESGGCVIRTFSGNEGGIITLCWKGEDDMGKPVKSGTYCFELESGGLTDRRKMILVR